MKQARQDADYQADLAAQRAQLAAEMAECPDCTGPAPSVALHIAAHNPPPVCTVCKVIAPYGCEYCPLCGVEIEA